MVREAAGMILVAVGATLLAIGVFLPAVHAPYVGSVNFLTSGDSPRMVMFAMAIVALILALFGWIRHALWPGLLSLAAIGYGYWRVHDYVARLEERFGDGLLRRFVERATGRIQLEWGWAMLVLGALLILAGAIIAWRQQGRPASPLTNRIAVLSGAVLVAAGMFLPLLHTPYAGSVAQILGGEAPRIVMFLAGLAALLLGLFSWTKHAVWAGLAGLGALAYSFYNLQVYIQAIEGRFGDGMLHRAAERATQLIQLQWGWAVLVIGLTLVLTGSGLAWTRRMTIGTVPMPGEGPLTLERLRPKPRWTNKPPTDGELSPKVEG